jgi:hypothetical protein
VEQRHLLRPNAGGLIMLCCAFFLGFFLTIFFAYPANQFSGPKNKMITNSLENRQMIIQSYIYGTQGMGRRIASQ